jgi:hypothetical protein
MIWMVGERVDCWNGPYLKGGLLMDSWNRPRMYRYPLTRGGHDDDSCSGGPPSAMNGSDAICDP